MLLDADVTVNPNPSITPCITNSPPGKQPQYFVNCIKINLDMSNYLVYSTRPIASHEKLTDTNGNNVKTDTTDKDKTSAQTNPPSSLPSSILPNPV
jgi:hypothetical protein